MTSTGGPRVVAIGGGHGLAMSLRAIEAYAGHLTAVVATGDDGGSSGRLRADLDMPAPGDLRRCLSALAADETVAHGFEHRFSAGPLEGHAVGNLVLAGLVDAGHDLGSAADVVSGWLGIDPNRVRILPATDVAVDLVADTDRGTVRGQVQIEESTGVRSVGFDPPAPPVPDEVLAAIGRADQIVLGPGSFFTSVMGVAAVPDIAKAIDAADAVVTLVANLDADPGVLVDRLRAHGIDPDVVVVQTGMSCAAPAGVQIVEADIVRPHGLAHDPALLSTVLATPFSTS
ncbi:gluconeogenesis factor YvcK family protein [Actinospongicola halichondriae]|uniref:gluconeogenesis factor YvcK family protein n=1 Tax=Actinospongicola halichondriae TaxID=3236844 RepID=UPI003D38620B